MLIFPSNTKPLHYNEIVLKIIACFLYLIVRFIEFYIDKNIKLRKRFYLCGQTICKKKKKIKTDELNFFLCKNEFNFFFLTEPIKKLWVYKILIFISTHRQILQLFRQSHYFACTSNVHNRRVSHRLVESDAGSHVKYDRDVFHQIIIIRIRQTESQFSHVTQNG